MIYRLDGNVKRCVVMEKKMWLSGNSIGGCVARLYTEWCVCVCVCVYIYVLSSLIDFDWRKR
jgi:hypothetical protein